MANIIDFQGLSIDNQIRTSFLMDSEDSIRSALIWYFGTKAEIKEYLEEDVSEIMLKEIAKFVSQFPKDVIDKILSSKDEMELDKLVNEFLTSNMFENAVINLLSKVQMSRLLSYLDIESDITFDLYEGFTLFRHNAKVKLTKYYYKIVSTSNYEIFGRDRILVNTLDSHSPHHVVIKVKPYKMNCKELNEFRDAYEFLYKIMDIKNFMCNTLNFPYNEDLECKILKVLNIFKRKVYCRANNDCGLYS